MADAFINTLMLMAGSEHRSYRSSWSQRKGSFDFGSNLGRRRETTRLAANTTSRIRKDSVRRTTLERYRTDRRLRHDSGEPVAPNRGLEAGSGV